MSNELVITIGLVVFFFGLGIASLLMNCGGFELSRYNKTTENIKSENNQ